MTDLLERDPAPSERPRIDPRIAQRWIEARREEGRRRLHLLFAVAAAAAGLALAVGSLYTPLFRVGHVRITVDGPLSVQTIGRLAGVTTRTQTIDVHSGAIASRLDAYPLLGAARVARHWPGTVTISVAVRSPLAVVARPSGWAEVDPTGRVLADVASAPPGIPVLQGVGSVPPTGGWLAGTAGPAAAPAASPGRLVDMAAAVDGPDVPGGGAAALAFIDALPPLLRADVASVTIGRGGGLSLVVSPPRMATGTVTVLLGDGSQLQAKVTALVTLLNEGDLSGVAGLDLTVPSRPATASSVAGLSPAPANGASQSGTAQSATPQSGGSDHATGTAATLQSGVSGPATSTTVAGAGGAKG